MPDPELIDQITITGVSDVGGIYVPPLPVDHDTVVHRNSTQVWIWSVAMVDTHPDFGDESIGGFDDAFADTPRSDGRQWKAIACAARPEGGANVVALVAGNLWYATANQVDGYHWTHVHSPKNDGVGDLTAISCANGLDRALHVVGLVDGNVWYGTRLGNESWQPFQHVHGPKNDGVGDVISVACATEPNGTLHVVGLVQGNIWHGVRHVSGAWDGFEHVHSPKNDGVGDFTTVTCAVDTVGALHVSGLIKGNIWHGKRDPDSTWSQFEHVHALNNEGMGDVEGLGAVTQSDGTLVILYSMSQTDWVTRFLYNPPYEAVVYYICHVTRSVEGQWSTTSPRSYFQPTEAGFNPAFGVTLGPVIPKGWTPVPERATDVGCGGGQTWITMSDASPGGHVIARWDGRPAWNRIDGGAVRVAVGPDGQPWVINDNQSIFRRVGNSWENVPGAAQDIGVGADGSVWVVGTEPSPGGFQVWKWDGAAWSLIEGGAVRIAVGPDGLPWVINNNLKIYRRTAAGWIQIPGEATDIGIGGDGSVFIVGFDAGSTSTSGQSLWRRYGDHWSLLPGVGAQISVSTTGLAWIVNGGGAIFHRS